MKGKAKGFHSSGPLLFRANLGFPRASSLGGVKGQRPLQGLGQRPNKTAPLVEHETESRPPPRPSPLFFVTATTLNGSGAGGVAPFAGSASFVEGVFEIPSGAEFSRAVWGDHVVAAGAGASHSLREFVNSVMTGIAGELLVSRVRKFDARHLGVEAFWSRHADIFMRCVSWRFEGEAQEGGTQDEEGETKNLRRAEHAISP
ncbi:hypothetical protein SAMN02745702_02646 [Desulfobaculum bizertense DSM 18034]|uniref:Uncharacterized protein n=1 Tax=Desulfobaculum bizertense DSM 18034 TaxID=1121442 RepID=A0A1T4WST7_9BACT|nr:hypothetical protein SAMN02745702_02646 [Desulfobaculum bizertense DSM 18034]